MGQDTSTASFIRPMLRFLDRIDAYPGRKITGRLVDMTFVEEGNWDRLCGHGYETSGTGQCVHSSSIVCFHTLWVFRNQFDNGARAGSRMPSPPLPITSSRLVLWFEISWTRADFLTQCMQ
ncbi:hypothetical protein M413DRAFT_449812 [Hebeloma cylindrosporum]|uniref:Uncharacterized protein n=1 Tax=Hebeloma cylindrosporum TaxID=76867 RepID=A0A0C2Y2N8_HEBCY|nr:hypothetical protein M413DRAFT_449812 [Hebeloma cylindrosporum h7]